MSCRVIALLTLNLDSRWKGDFNITPWLLYPTKSTLVLIERRLGGLRSHSGRLGDLKKIRCLCRDSKPPPPPVQRQNQSISCRRHWRSVTNLTLDCTRPKLACICAHVLAAKDGRWSVSCSIGRNYWPIEHVSLKQVPRRSLGTSSYLSAMSACLHTLCVLHDSWQNDIQMAHIAV